MKQPLAAVFVLLVGATAAAQTHSCPSYQAWGGTSCEWIAYCADGRPWQGEACGQATPPPPAAQPQPQPQPQPLEPRPRVLPPLPPPPTCSGGQILRDGRCVCPDGYSWNRGSCKPISRDCEVRSIYAAVRGRKVLLVNGRAWNLFQRYVGDFELQHIEPDYEALRVYVYGPDGHREELRATLAMGDLFLGTTYKDKWRRILRNKLAADRPLPQEDAKLLDSDLICGQR
jgi:hypothetical protein